MSPNVRKRIHLIYGIVFSAVTLVAGVCLMAACYGIYSAGLQSGADQIFTRTIVAEAFSVIAVPVYLCLALSIGSFLLHLALPLQPKTPVPEKNRQLILSRLQTKTDLARCDAGLRADIGKQQARRKRDTLITAIVLALCSVLFLAYALMPGRWPETSQVTGAVEEATLVLLGCLALPTLLAIWTAYRNRNSLDKEIALMKQAAAQAPKQPEMTTAAENKKVNWLLIARYAIVVIAIVCILYGYNKDGFIDVIAKAAAICTECVGLG